MTTFSIATQLQQIIVKGAKEGDLKTTH